MYITRTLISSIVNTGFIIRVVWIFQQSNKEMWYLQDGDEYPGKVPYMRGKLYIIHGSEDDTVIAKGYVTNSYINNRGKDM